MSQIGDTGRSGERRDDAAGGTDSRPVSWPVLEAYALGELDDGEAAQVEAHLADDEASRRCLAMIREQQDRPLPPLPEMAPRTAGAEASASLPDDRTPARAASRWRRIGDWLKQRWSGQNIGWSMAAAGVAVAVLALVVLGRGSQNDPAGAGWPAPRAVVKGGDVLVLGVVRERSGAITHDPSGFSPRDRFKLVITCEPGAEVMGQVVVYQDGEASFPLGEASRPGCGNRVAIPGAFRITGEGPAAVCLAYSLDAPPSRSALASGLGNHPAVCVSLSPEK